MGLFSSLFSKKAPEPTEKLELPWREEFLTDENYKDWVEELAAPNSVLRSGWTARMALLNFSYHWFWKCKQLERRLEYLESRLTPDQ